MSPNKAIGLTFDESQEPGLTNQINSSVDKGAEKLKVFETDVKKLISTLKKQHDTMKAFNDARLETAKVFESFVANTPITKAMGEIDTEKDKAAVFKKKSVPKQSANSSSASVASSSKTPITSVKNATADVSVVSPASTAAKVSVTPKNETETMPAEDEEITVDTALMMSSSKDSDETPESNEEVSDVKSSFIEHQEDSPVALKTSDEEEAQMTTIPFEKQVIKGSEYAQVDISNLSIAQASHKLTVTYADQYQSNVIDYAEEWLQSVTSRIKSRLIEFDKLRESLNHYVSKVAELRADVQRLEANNKTITPKKSEKLERNELKLNGAREAHHIFGQSLYLLIDEVTARGWRDLYPLIVNSIHFDQNYSSDQAKLYSKLETISDMLEEVAEDDPHGLDIEGRLEKLKRATPEEVYTGKEYSKVHPVLRAAAV